VTLNYTTRGQVKIAMYDYVDEFITAFDKAEPKGGDTETSAVPDSLFKVEEICKKLAQNKAVEFHNLVAKFCMPPSGQGQIPAPQSHS
jgi:hypothetical protein